jgi:hypothetical protein
MKKLLTSILALLYLSTSMGATVHLHYCMGKLASWGLIDHKSKNCTKCGMVKQDPASRWMTAKMGCCKDEHKQIKTENDQKLSLSEFFKYNILSQAPALNNRELHSIRAFSIATTFPNTNAPPLLDKLPLFTLYRNFRI